MVTHTAVTTIREVDTIMVAAIFSCWAFIIVPFVYTYGKIQLTRYTNRTPVLLGLLWREKSAKSPAGCKVESRSH